MKTALLASAALAALSTAASAHATWIAWRGAYAVVHGEGRAKEAYAPEAVTGAKAIGADGSVRLRGADEAAVPTAAFAGGWWTEDAQGKWHNEAPEGFAGFRSAGEYFEHPVTVVGTPADLGRPLGNKLELVPLVDPTTLDVGVGLPVQVLFDGAPLAGAEVAQDVLSSWDLARPTDAEGRTTLTVQNEGFNVAAVYHELPTAENVVEGHSATLAYARVWPEE